MLTREEVLCHIKPLLVSHGLSVHDVVRVKWYDEYVGWIVVTAFSPGTQHVGMPPVYSITRSGLIMGPDRGVRPAQLRLLDWYTLPDDPELPV